MEISVARIIVCFVMSFHLIRFHADAQSPDVSSDAYIGCFDDVGNDAVFIRSLRNLSNLTPEYCSQWCRNQEFSYIGLWAGINCWCAPVLNGSSSAVVVKVDDRRCSASCSGDQSQSCGGVAGGGNIYSVYSVCPRTKWGRHCKRNCNCKDNNHCSVQGVCPGRECSDGWQLKNATTRQDCSVDVDECELKCNSTHTSNCHNCDSELNERCNNTRGSFECICKIGFLKDNASGKCMDINECDHNETHDCSQECNNYEGGFNCSCGRGYELEGFSNCKDVDECTRDMHGCNQTCHNTDGSYSCNCTRGFTIDSDGYQCNDINECETGTHSCIQNCNNFYGGFSCSCRSGFQLEGFSNCRDIDECRRNRTICDQMCNNTEGSYFCGCRSGFSLDENDKRKCHDINECSDNNGNCNQTCKNTIGSYNCSCDRGYQLSGDKHTCEDINECQDGTEECQHDCWNSIGSYECSCDSGFELNDDHRTCSDINECLRNLSKCNQNCANTIGNYNCSCFDGYKLNNDSFTCFDINECEVENGGCQHYCSNTPGGFNCSCQPGYRGIEEDSDTSKYNCTDIDECAEKSSNCEHTCNNTIGSHVCSCHSGFDLQTDKFSCKDIDECELNAHNCAQECKNRIGNYSCDCKNGYYLIGLYHCEKDMTVTVLAVTIFLLFILLLAMVLVGLRMKGIFPFDKPRFGGLWRQRGQENPHENGTNELKDLKELKTNNSEKQNLLPVATTAVAKKEKTRKTSVAIKDLKRYIANIESNEGFEDEFRSIQMVSDFSYQEAQAQALKPKNRFKNILPYDHNRVVLNEINDDPLTTYINASFIKGYSSKDKIIASHGPTPNTLNDFWRMIWQFDVGVIVMVTKCMEDGKVKCEQYWPLEGSMESGELTIVLDSTEAWPDYVISRLKVTKENTSRLIVHLLFTDWPDHGVPDHATSLISFRRAARNVIVEDKYFLVHCSAGVGRTGTFLAIDYLLQQAEAEGSVDVYKFLQGLRDQRMHAVQTTDQYEFIHDALLETLTLGETTVQCPALPDYMKHLDKINPITGKSYFTTQFDMLQEMHPLLSKESTSIALDPKNLSKNRDEAIVPGDSNRVFLSDDSGGDDYINAVFVSSYRRKDAFISAELPLPETVKNFWLLTLNYRCRIVVFLDLSNNADDLNSCLLIPEKTKLSINRHKFWTSSPDPKTISSNCDSYLVSVSTPLDDDEDIYANAEEIAAFKILVLHFRLSAALLPTLLPEIHDQIKKSSESIKDKGSVVIVSRDGVNPTGQLIAVTNLLEMSNSQHEVDIFNAVHNIKKSQPHFISTIAEYRTIYDAIVQVESDFSTYANY